MNFKLLETLCQIRATSGDEANLKHFLIEYVNQKASNWKSVPKIIEGNDFQDNLMLVFGKPNKAFYAHIDSVGFTAQYQNQLITVGSPDAVNGDILVGEDSLGPIECSVIIDKNNHSFHGFNRKIDSGTTLTYKPNYAINADTITSCYLDNRLGVFTLLQLAEEMENGVLVFSTYEEHGGGSAGYLATYLYKKFKLKKALIIDVTWETGGIHFGQGPVVSLRDAYIPRKTFIDKILFLLDESSLIYQKEVEASGGSDGSELQRSPLPIDWCFLGVAIKNSHASTEEANIFDLVRLVSLLKILATKL